MEMRRVTLLALVLAMLAAVAVGKDKGLPLEESKEGKALLAVTDKEAEGHGTEELAEHLYHGIHIIHQTHIGLELVHIAEHKAMHGKAVNSFRAMVGGLHGQLDANYKNAWLTAERFIAAVKTEKEAAAALLKMKSATQREAMKQSLQRTRDYIKTSRPAAAKALIFFREYVRSVYAVLKQWRATLGPLVSSGTAASAQALRTKTQAFVRGSAKVLTTAGRGIKVGNALAVGHKTLTAFVYLGAALEGVHGVMTTKAESVAGILAVGIGKGGVGYVIMSHPALALADLVLPKSLSPGQLLKDSVDVIVAIGELAFNDNPAMAAKFLENVKKGKAHVAMQIAVALGESLAGNHKAWEDFNKRNLSGKNGAIMHLAAGYGELLATGNTQALADYQNKALKGEYGVIAETLATTGKFWSENTFRDAFKMVVGPQKTVVAGPVSTDTGVYLKVVSCTGLTSKAPEPYFKCYPLGDLDLERKTTVGTSPRASTFLFDSSTGGFGMKWSKSKVGRDVPRCVNCDLWDAKWLDEKTDGYFVSCEDGEKKSIDLKSTKGKALARGKCTITHKYYK